MQYIIGTRGSKLALTQSEYVRDRLAQAYPQHTFALKVIKTKGDLNQDRPLSQIGDKGLFVTEIENEILSGEVHIGVHSMKDMPAVPADGLCFTDAWKREDPRDVLILRNRKNLWDLPQGAVIGTGSVRRQLQLKRLRPDIVTVDIRGNVDSRLRKMEEQKLDGIVLAAAGLNRLGMTEWITQYLSFSEMVPAPAQGILALEIQKDNKELAEMLNMLSDEDTQKEAAAERGFLREIEGSCHIPVGAVCEVSGDMLELRCIYGTEDGGRTVFAKVSGQDPEDLAKSAAREIRRQLSGKVYLVGGGPGDPGLITVKGMQAIRDADCIVYDRLSSPELLNHVKSDCDLIYVGKANHNHTMKQEDINKLLVKKAMEHKKVVRLKGGDVYVFGRGGEEGVFLREHGVPFEVIPGISSSIAGLAYAGIPITHRGIATGFHVVTAHNKKDELADIDFAAMAKGEDTCVFLMGLSEIDNIAKGLLEAGMPEKTPAAVISSATTSRQRTVTGTLNEIAKEVAEAGLISPALIVVGKTVELRKYLNFFEERPLFGKYFFVPKIGNGISPLAQRLEELGATVEQIQVGQITEVKQELSKEMLQKISWIVFTSQYGVRSFFENLYASGLDLRAMSRAKVAAIGEKTAKVLKEYGVIVDLLPEKSNSDALCEALKSVLRREDMVLYPKGANADSSLKNALGGLCCFTEAEIYENAHVSFQIPKETPDGIFFTCASSARRYIAQSGPVQNSKVFSIGPKCSAALKELGILDVTEAKEYNYDGLVTAALQTKW